ncbi:MULTISPECIES: hypothetical protein [unclassified Sutcliffiella]|uniref:hypothetical protein n=1 Tax=unclassified Sutcliffiella TaxID=2837532 RepID=UPI0030D36332
MVFVFKFKNIEYEINSNQVNIEDGNLLRWLDEGVKENRDFDFHNQKLKFSDIESVEILLHKTIKYS